jgi:hypothetical protein
MNINRVHSLEEVLFYRTYMNSCREVFIYILVSLVQRTLSIHAAIYNLFNFGCHLVSAIHYRLLRQEAILSWRQAAAV